MNQQPRICLSAAALLCSVSLSAGCLFGAGSGDSNPPARDGSEPADARGDTASGEDSDDGASSEVSKIDNFTGTWKYRSGTVIVTCRDQTTNFDVSGNVNISEGTNSDLVYDSDSCKFEFDLSSAASAEIVPGQNCIIQDEDGATTLTPSSWTLRIDGDKMTEEGSGSGKVQNENGTFDCNFEVSSSLNKQSE